MGVFHHDLKWTVQSCRHKNRGSGLNLDSAAAFSILALKAQNVVENISGLRVFGPTALAISTRITDQIIPIFFFFFLTHQQLSLNNQIDLILQRVVIPIVDLVIDRWCRCDHLMINPTQVSKTQTVQMICYNYHLLKCQCCIILIRGEIC